MMQKWLAVVGIGEDGVSGLSAIARSLVENATVLVGGDRHLRLVPEDDRERLVWTSPIDDSVDEILRRRGQSVCVLASGDPMCYGIGATLTRRISVAEMTLIPAPSTFSLMCARLGWSLAEVETLSLCGRPVALLQTCLYPGAKVLLLSAGRQTPGQVAQALVQQGFGPTQMTVFEHLGGPQERLVSGTAGTWAQMNLADLNAIALDCQTAPGVQPLSMHAGTARLGLSPRWPIDKA